MVPRKNEKEKGKKEKVTTNDTFEGFKILIAFVAYKEFKIY